MMINRFLRDHRFIFPKSTNLEYLRTLIELGSIPIVMKITKDGYKPVIFDESYWNKIYLGMDSGLFDYDICNLSDIKHILSSLSSAFNNLVISLHDLPAPGVEIIIKYYVTEQGIIR